MEAMRHVAHEEIETPDEFVVEVVRRVAETKGIDPLDVDERLHDSVDAEAVWRLFRDRPAATGRVEFELAGTVVTVSADGEISVRPR